MRIYVEVVEPIEGLLKEVVDQGFGFEGDRIYLDNAGVVALAPICGYIYVTVMIYTPMNIHRGRICRAVSELKSLSIKKVLSIVTRRPFSLEQVLRGRDETRRLLGLIGVIYDDLFYRGIRSDDLEEAVIECDEVSRIQVDIADMHQFQSTVLSSRPTFVAAPGW